MEKSISFSLARYLAAGIPVIVPAGSSQQTLIEINHLGIAVNTLEEAVSAVESITEEEYREYLQSVGQFAPALRNGYYTKKCLIEAMQAFYRKDAGRISLSEKNYGLGEHSFSSAVLNESYGGKLAFSWDYQGEAEGFLVYDTEGMLQGNTKDIYQHYILLKRQENREKGFIIKAYVETLKGRLILAESEPVYLSCKSIYEEPAVSMIIPAYNAEKYIARCIDMVLAQSQPDVEIIVVDDGSRDRTPEIAKWYAEKYDNVLSIHQENSGPAVARNSGIEYARGEYVGFVDADDMIRVNMVKRLYQSAKKNDCDIATTSIYMVTDSAHIKRVEYSIKEDTPVAVEEFFPQYTHGDRTGVVVWNKLYRSSVVKKHPIPVMNYEDNAWMPYILSYIKRICYLNDYSYEWDRRTQGGSLSFGLVRRPAEETFADIKRTILFYLQNGNPEKINLLKEVALEEAKCWEGSVYHEGYGRLRIEIEENY